ncbi:MAG: SLC13 family permease, partial [Burkholderiales bacterium]
PYLLALAAAANAGSAATVIGNPQNILIGQVGQLDFLHFLAICGPPAAIALALVYFCIAWAWREELATAREEGETAREAPPVPLDRWQTAKGALAAAAIVILFLSDLPHEIGALAIAALLLASRRLASRDMLGTVDWHLLLLFACLFGVTAAFGATGLPGEALQWLAARGLAPESLALLLPISLAASNTVGNVPAVILILGIWPAPPEGALYALALLTTLSGNLLLTGSIANLIVAERAQAVGLRLSFADFARAGIPMTLASLAVAALWLWAVGAVVV